ncbi:MAG: ABC transporter permease [Acutalibacteraceae bacterium]|nr:ABC transporter permease [Acutalibacteraceae bacterium]
MDIIDYCTTAIQAFFSNKKRSMLTALGIIVGMCSVIMLSTIGTYIEQTMDKLVYLVLSGNKMSLSIVPTDSSTIEYDDYGEIILPENEQFSPSQIEEINEYFSDDCKPIVELDPMQYFTKQKDGKEITVSVVGCSDAFLETSGVKISSGRSLNDTDCAYGSSAILLADNFAESYYSGNDPIGQTFQITDYNGSLLSFTVVGTYQIDVSIAAFTQVYIPYSFEYKYMDVEYASRGSLNYLIPDDIDIAQLEQKANEFFSTYFQSDTHTVKAGFLTETINLMRSFVSIIAGIVTIIAAVSLIVGGIGIMNVMLVSVTERTNEIGTRKACGALNIQIRIQFILESLVISVFGSILGICIGLYLSKTILVIIHCLLPDIRTELSVSPLIMIGAAIYTILVGVICGIYPADKAVKMNLVDSLRYE